MNALGKSSIEYIVPEYIPRIPISSLSLQRLHHVQALAIARARYDEVHKQEQSPPLSSTRRLVEDLRIAESKIEEIDAIHQSVMFAPWTRFAPEAIALEITHIDTGLFSAIVVRTDLVPHALIGLTNNRSLDTVNGTSTAPNDGSTLPSTKKVATVQALVDFHEYLTHIAMEGVLSAPRPSFAIHTLVYIAYLLLYVYRDLSATVSLIHALNSVIIRRLRVSCWDHVHPKAKEVLKHLTHQASQTSNHLELTRQILCHHFKGGGIVSCIPWLDPFLDSIRHIYMSYTVNAVGNLDSNISNHSNIVLSDIGDRMLVDEVFKLIEMCRGLNRWDKDRDTIFSTNSRMSGGPVDITGIPLEAHGATSNKKALMLAQNNLTDLDTGGDFKVAHWLLTRLYYDFEALFEKSTKIEKLEKEEIVPDFSSSAIRDLVQIDSE